MEITFLGTGTSHGVPIIGCSCSTCLSNNPKNKRYRSSIYIELDTSSLLIDTAPELRLQLIRNNITTIDAVLFTHTHADHLMGFDDLRGINRLQKKAIPCYGNQRAIKEIKRVFSYIFNPFQIGGGIPEVTLHQVSENFEIKNSTIVPIPIKHGKLDILGYRIANMAYLTDCSFISAESYRLLEGIDLLIIDALRYEPHSTHMNIDQALEVVNKLEVPQTYFTHLSHRLEHESVNKDLPNNVQLAYDGLKISI
ncbi:MBL fold metallo-hydrolase [Orenia marismortui]|uniref:Phosphoribosyl 1,2-cyclic phosphate phosphodiesterase n=1 Tax=Orenia marismortui TaxID=46469 RepID=A0A4R8GSI8_9FIRM|nr:MBL fold metallo-hydrolase [Orenia marismortui]TDX48905.1 phosphoribosyl 1,2-cyclic phosphate phosphodiesterase [Orenia marismortui]